MPASAYSRNPSAEEAREGYLLILKSSLSLFPPIGEPWELADGLDQRRVTIEAEHCVCRGPELPHDHYRLRLPGLVRGSRVTIRPTDGGYRLER